MISAADLAGNSSWQLYRVSPLRQLPADEDGLAGCSNRLLRILRNEGPGSEPISIAGNANTKLPIDIKFDSEDFDFRGRNRPPGSTLAHGLTLSVIYQSRSYRAFIAPQRGHDVRSSSSLLLSRLPSATLRIMTSFLSGSFDCLIRPLVFSNAESHQILERYLSDVSELSGLQSGQVDVEQAYLAAVGTELGLDFLVTDAEVLAAGLKDYSVVIPADELIHDFLGLPLAPDHAPEQAQSGFWERFYLWQSHQMGLSPPAHLAPTGKRDSGNSSESQRAGDRGSVLLNKIACGAWKMSAGPPASLQLLKNNGTTAKDAVDLLISDIVSFATHGTARVPHGLNDSSA